MSRPAYSGRLSPWTVPALLRDLRAEKRTGLLRVDVGEAKRALRWREGRITAGLTNVTGERLPDWLLQLGLVAARDLDEALAEMRQKAKSLPDVLTERGLVDAAGLSEAATHEARAVLEQALSASEGDYAFHDEPAPSDDARTAIPTERLILELVARVTDEGVVRYTVGDPSRTLALGKGLRFEELSLTAADGFFLSRVDGDLSAHEVMELLPLEPSDAMHVLFRLLCAGVVEFHGPARAARALPEIATLAAERASRLAPPRPEPLPAMEEDVAIASLAKAEAEMAAGRPQEAALVLESVVGLVEGDLRARVRRVLAEALLLDPSSTKRGEEQLHVLVAERPSDVEAYFRLGEVYRVRGLGKRADAMFRRVLELDPAHDGARGALPVSKAAPPPPPTPPPGLLGRLFGRDPGAG
jgi:tetratricopeptide (TPR) repeat protein